MIKNKMIIVITFFMIYLLGISENLGEKIFLKNSDFYFQTSEVNIFELENKDLELSQKILEKYKNYNGLDLKELLYGKEYAIATIKNKIMIIVKMPTTIFMDSKFYDNNAFENDFLEQINTYYALGERQFIYAYNDGKLFISNDITLFFDTIKNTEDVLSKKDIFIKLMSKEKGENYKYYKENNEEVIKKGYKIKSEAGYGFENKMEKFYYIGEVEKKEKKKKIKTINFADVLEKGIKIETSLNMDILKEKLNNDFSIMEREGEEEFYNRIQERIEVLINVINKTGNYIILYTEEDGKQIIKEIIEEYEKIFFYDKKISAQENEEIKEIKIPLLDINKYIYLKNNNYIIIGENKEDLEDIKNGKYYNFEYTNIGTDGKIYNKKIEEEIGKESIEEKIEDGILEEKIELK